MNKVILTGYLAADPEMRTTQSGISQCTMRLAVRRRFANADGKRDSDFFNVVAWRATADFCGMYLEKGRKIAVEGSLQTRTYDAQDGSKRHVTEVIADSVEFCDRAPEEKRGYARDDSRTSAAQNDGFVEVDDEELPF